jgi:hypothetical protein
VSYLALCYPCKDLVKFLQSKSVPLIREGHVNKVIYPAKTVFCALEHQLLVQFIHFGISKPVSIFQAPPRNEEQGYDKASTVLYIIYKFHGFYNVIFSLFRKPAIRVPAGTNMLSYINPKPCRTTWGHSSTLNGKAFAGMIFFASSAEPVSIPISAPHYACF